MKEIVNLTGRICKGSLETVNISHLMALKNKIEGLSKDNI